jgi:Na+-transporting NADH:ubiquinone oxidoreductase subunit NqrC
MRGRINKQTLYLILFSTLLLSIIVLFSIFVLIPKGKEYRLLRLEAMKEEKVVGQVQKEHKETSEKLEKLKKSNAKTIKAFTTPFNPRKFTKVYAPEFQDLFLKELSKADENGSFKVYEVNVTTKITSPESFYNFLEKVNKSQWIIGVNFPIHFERDGDLIKSSFTMKVHNHEPK